MKRVIVNADDFGWNDHTFEWTVKGFECGALTSASIMAGMPATDRAVEFANAHPEFSFGVHFYLVDEKPMSRPEDIPSLIDPATGRLWRTRQFILKNFAGALDVEDLKRELRTQYTALKDLGLDISHVDGHGHNHRLPQSLKALEALKEELGIDRVRRCQDLFCGKSGLLSRLINRPMQTRMEDCGFSTADHFLMNAGHSDDPKWFSKALAALPDGITEIGIHPGVDEPWRKIDTEDCYACDFKGVEKITYWTV